jgi:hypothetical protein
LAADTHAPNDPFFHGAKYVVADCKATQPTEGVHVSVALVVKLAWLGGAVFQLDPLFNDTCV